MGGGRVYGYDNVPVLGPSGERDHTVRRINEAQAAVVRRVSSWRAARDLFLVRPSRA